MNHDLQNNKIVGAIDIGTSKVVALIGSKDESGKINILGMGVTESDGLFRGVISNIDKSVGSIKKALDQAEQQAGVQLKEVYVGIAGDHIDSFQTQGIVGISNPEQEITKQDVERLLEETKHIKIPSERQIIHAIPQDYIIDGQDGITDPVGMSGVRLEGNVHIITGMSSAIKNIKRCIEKAGLIIKDIVLEPIASSHAVLSEEEKEVGVALIDIGGGTTDIAVFDENIIRYTSVFAIAGKQVTDDIRKALGIVEKEAERIKREFGHAFSPSIIKNDIFMVKGINGRKPTEVSKELLSQVVQPRMEEILEFAAREIYDSGFYGRLGAGAVITGGTTLLRGTDELASQVLGMPVKIGIPSGITYSGLGPEIESPIYSTSVGLIRYGLDILKDSGELNKVNLKETDEENDEDIKDSKKAEKPENGGFFKNVKEFLKEL